MDGWEGRDERGENLEMPAIFSETLPLLGSPRHGFLGERWAKGEKGVCRCGRQEKSRRRKAKERKFMQ